MARIIASLVGEAGFELAFGTAAKPLKTDADAMQTAELTCKH